MNEYDPGAVQRWLKPLVQQHGITVIVTDDLSSYKVVADKLHLDHQICQFHVRCWVGRTLRELQDTVPKEWRWVLEEVKQLLEGANLTFDRIAKLVNYHGQYRDLVEAVDVKLNG